MSTRQTAFPGIWVENLRIQNPPFDESRKGIFKEFVGQGVLRDIEPIQRAADFSTGTVRGFIDGAEEMIGPVRDTFKLRYGLIVRTVPSVDASPRPVKRTVNKARERSVAARARVFVRAKNPFEPELIEVGTPRRNSRLSDEKLGDFYDVSVEVTK